MLHSSTTSQRSARQDGNTNHAGAIGPISASTKRALHAIVRRVLRMEVQRTRLERMVLKEARRLANVNPEIPAVTIVQLIVGKLQRRLPIRIIENPRPSVASVAFSDSPTVTIGCSNAENAL